MKHILRRLMLPILAPLALLVLLLLFNLASGTEFSQEERDWCAEEHPDLSLKDCSRHLTY